MKTTLDKNGWTIVVEEDIKSLSDEDIKQVCRLAVSNMVVVFKEQSITPQDQARICSVMGNMQLVSRQLAIDSENSTIVRVTGKKDSQGREGLFGHTYALDWHANQPSNKERKPLIWLYGAEHTAGSRTSWINNIISYEALDNNFKKEIADIEILCGYKQGMYSYSEYFKEHVNTDNPIKLVQTNKESKTGLFFPFLQIFGFKDRDESYFNDIMSKLKEHVLKEEFVYHHDWTDGDIILSEQWLSIHKRWPYDHMDKRVLHRIALDYSNIYPTS
jgi:taurine dioxygenase